MTYDNSRKYSLIAFGNGISRVMHVQSSGEKALVGLFRHNNKLLTTDILVKGFKVTAIDGKRIRPARKRDVYIGKLSSVEDYVAEQIQKNSEKPYAVVPTPTVESFQSLPPHLHHYNPKHIVTSQHTAKPVAIQPQQNVRVYDEETGERVLVQRRPRLRPPVMPGLKAIIH